MISSLTPDGLYFGMSAEDYHADPALGSTNLKDLLVDPLIYWWNSAYNPSREQSDTDSPSKKIGRAVHAFVLDGREVFEKSYGRCAYPGNIKAGKQEREDFEFQGLTPLRGEDYDRIVTAGTMIRANPALSEAFTNGMPEVSIFWTEEVDGEEVRRKARFDYLKIRAISDLKSHAPMERLTFRASCHRAVKLYNYALQAAAYLQGRRLLPLFVKQGLVFGDHDPEWLGKVAASKDFAFVLTFWASTGAPLTWGGVFSPQNPKITTAEADIELALHRFVRSRRRFGTEIAWIESEPLSEIDPTNIDEFWRMEGAAG